jgi:hypothetical protein
MDIKVEDALQASACVALMDVEQSSAKLLYEVVEHTLISYVETRLVSLGVLVRLRVEAYSASVYRPGLAG